MKNINLLYDIPNLRNTIGPKTRTPSQIARKQKLIRLLVLSLFFSFSIAYGLWFLDLYEPVKVIVIKTLAGAEAGHKPILAKPKKEEGIIKAAQALAPRQKENPEVMAKVDKSRLEPIRSRPVAKDAQILKAASRPSVWSVRFAVCVYKKSCVTVLEVLKKKGIKAFVKKGVAQILTHRVVIGPWVTVSGAKLAHARLKKIHIESSLFTAGERSYLSTEPMTDLASAKKILAEIRALGYRAEKKSAKEPQKIYKVYKGSYKNKQSAKALFKKYTAIGVKCVLEKHI